MATKEVFRVTVVLQAIRPDQVQVIYKLLLRFVVYVLEFFAHGAKIHGLFDDWKEQPLADAIESYESNILL